VTFGNLRLVLAAVLTGGLLLVSDASASVINTLNTGSSGNVTISLSSVIFNNDPAALPSGVCTTALGRGCNADVASGTSLTFVGGPLATGEGIYVNNNDLTLSAPSAADANSFLTFASHPNLVFSIVWPPGPGSANTDCATANSNGLSCSVFAGSPIILTYANGNTFVGLGVHGKASDTGVGGLAGGSSYTGGFSDFFSQNLPNGTAPTPQNIQLYFCPSGTCVAADFTSGRSITSSQSGTFTASAAATVPEPGSLALLGTGLLGLAGAMRRKLAK
jgi:PEP-CTERM motif